MKRWKQWARLAVIAAASCVLVVTVLPQVASGIGLGPLANRLASSGSCSSSGGGSGSSSTCSVQGTVTGTITVTGAPKGFVPAYKGAGACPDSGPAGMACANPIYALAGSSGTYTLALTPGKWRMAGFYEMHAYGGAFLGSPRVVSIHANKTITVNVTTAYRKPAAVKGSIAVTGVLSGFQVQQLTVLLCPSYAPFDGTFASIACVSGFSGQSGDKGTYRITGLPPGPWVAYPSFCTFSGEGFFQCFTNAKAGKAVTLTGGATATADLTTPFLVPGNGLLSGKVTVTGAPSGFSDPVAVQACQKQNCQTFSVSPGDTFMEILGDGTWSVNALYQAAPFYNSILGPTETVTISSGQTKMVALTDPYQVLGGATGAINVIGAPRVPIQSYTVLACPASTPWNGGLASPECLVEYSGPGSGIGGILSTSVSKVSHQLAVHAASPTAALNSYELSTLTAGAWLLYPGYQTVFGSYTDPVGTRIGVAPGKTTTRNLSVPYQLPTVGAVTGSVSVVGAPEFDFQTGVQACSAPPTANSCSNEQEGYDQSSGYQLALTPGTWWVSGFVDIYNNGPAEDQSMTPARKVVVKAGVETTENFTVVVSS